MTKTLLIDAVPGEVRVALLEDESVAEVQIFRDDDESRLGNIYLGRATHIDRSLQAAFLKLPDAVDAYLAARHAPKGPGRRIERRVTEGELVIVQVTKQARGDKGPEVTTRVSLPGHLAVYQPFKPGYSLSAHLENSDANDALLKAAEQTDPDGGGILRTAAAGAEPEHLQGEIRSLMAAWGRVLETSRKQDAPALLYRDLPSVERMLRDRATPDIAEIVVSDAALLARVRTFLGTLPQAQATKTRIHDRGFSLFEDRGVEDAIESTLLRHLPVQDGSWITFERTEALTAIDVNSGSAPRDGDPQRAALETNLAVVPLIAQQLRLRGIGGLVVIDFVNLDDRADRAKVTAALEEALTRDPVQTAIGGWTRLGLFELTRRRTRNPLPDILAGPLTPERPRQPTAETVAFLLIRRLLEQQRGAPAKKVTINAHPDVIRYLEGHVEDIVALTGRPPVLRSTPAATVETWDVYPED